MKKAAFIFCLVSNILYSQWTLLPTGTNMGFFSCSFVNTNTGWAAGDTVFNTSNGGVNWQALYNAPAGDRLDCMMFKNSYTGWAGSYQGWIYKTTDGGHNWSRIRVWYPRIFDIFFTDLNIGWVVGESGNCKKTTDGGNTWTASNSFGTYELDCVYFLNYNTGFVGGLYQFASTTNGGLNWNVGYMPNIVIRAIHFINGNTGWALGNKYNQPNSCSGLYVLKTQNAGLNWNLVCSESCTYGFHTLVQDAHFLTPDIGYFCGIYAFAPPPASQTCLFRKTTNGGVNWSFIYLSSSISSFEALDFADSQTGYITGYQGKIYKTTNGGEVGISQISTTIPSNFTLSQNYPNPFNPVTKIKFDVPLDSRLRGNDNVTLKIFDVLGRETATLVNERLSPGTYEVEWDGTNYPSGVYFYKLITNDYSKTRKMVLLK